MPQEKKNIVIFGASGHAKVIIDSIEKCELYNIVGLIDSYKDIKYSIFEYSILGTENEIVALSKEYNFYRVPTLSQGITILPLRISI
jgi:FlaA1/EpsC-like NDP-sugar epimerase